MEAGETPALQFLFHAPPQRIEHERERPVGLSAMLRAESEEHDLALAVGHGHSGGFAGEALGAVDPAGEEHVTRVLGIRGQDPALHVGGGGGGVEGECGILEGGDELAGKPAVILAPRGKGNVLLFANNPMWRMHTVGAYPLVVNAILNWEKLR